MTTPLLPGPPGSTNGDYWPGDTVTLHTGTTEWDYNEAAMRVKAITVQRADENAELVVIPELVTTVPGVPNYTGEVMGTYLYGKEYSGYGYWQDTGDNEPVGWLEIPLVGPITYDQGSAPRYSLTVGANMIATLAAAMDWGGALGETVYLYIKVNGVTVGEDSYTGGGGYENFRLEVTVPDYQLYDGDVVSGITAPAGYTGWGNDGINGTFLRVYRP